MTETTNVGFRIVGIFQSKSSMDSKKPWINEVAWGTRDGLRCELAGQSWCKAYGWGNSVVELYLAPAAQSQGKFLAGLRQRMSSADSKKPWLVKKQYGTTTGDHVDVYFKAWSAEYGWGYSVVEFYLAEQSILGGVTAIRQSVSNQAGTAPFRLKVDFGQQPVSPWTVNALAWSRDYSWGNSRIEMDVATATRVDPVAAEIASFQASSAPPAWPTLDKQQLISDIRSTVRDAYQVNQGPSPLCGPAAVVFELVRRNPVRYVQMCRALYETGRCATDSGVIQPGDTCRTSAPQPELRQADWMLLAAMRDAANALFPVTSNSGGIAGISTPDELMGWSRAVLGMANVHYESTVVYGEFAAMRGAQKVLDRGGAAFLLISASLLTGARPAVRIPDHWVAHTGATSIDYGTWWKHDSGSIKFDCFSLGQAPARLCRRGYIRGLPVRSGHGMALSSRSGPRSDARVHPKTTGEANTSPRRWVSGWRLSVIVRHRSPRGHRVIPDTFGRLRCRVSESGTGGSAPRTSAPSGSSTASRWIESSRTTSRGPREICPALEELRRYVRDGDNVVVPRGEA